MADRITTHIEPEIMLPAVGQGALCIESRINDKEIGPIVSGLDHAGSHTAVLAERAFSQHLEGGCQVPIAAHATIDDDRLQVTGLVAELDGRRVLKDTVEGSCDQAAVLGLRLAEKLLALGAGPILERIMHNAQ
jgi:hydroxymethylbilane synthase